MERDVSQLLDSKTRDLIIQEEILPGCPVYNSLKSSHPAELHSSHLSVNSSPNSLWTALSDLISFCFWAFNPVHFWRWSVLLCPLSLSFPGSSWWNPVLFLPGHAISATFAHPFAAAITSFYFVLDTILGVLQYRLTSSLQKYFLLR